MNKLSFGNGNAKLSNNISTFSLPAGYTCNFADKCFALANRKSGKIIDGKNTEFRCFAASTEAVFPNVRKSRWDNFELLKSAETIEKMANLIQTSLPFKLGIIRCHVAGDFFNEKYFLAWLNVAMNNQDLIIYGYTKCLNFLVKYKKHIPSNFRFTASKGGKLDSLISKHKLKYAEVVFSVKESLDKGLEIDHDDSLAIANKQSFALILHGSQSPNSNASNALKQLKSQGLGFYNEDTKKEVAIKPVKIYITLDSVKTPSYKFIPYTKGLLIK